MKKCKKCNKEFKAHGNAKYCDKCDHKVAGSDRKISRTKIRNTAKKHYQKKRKIQICKLCKNNLQYKEGRKFCNKCKNRFLARIRSLQQQVCFICNKDKKKNQIYCSVKCYKIGNYFLKSLK